MHTTSILSSAALVAASLAMTSAAAAAADDDGCIPAGATALKMAPAGEASVYRFPGGPITACDGANLRLELAGWRDQVDVLHGFEGAEKTEFVAAAGKCVVYTQYIDDGGFPSAGPKMYFVDTKLRRNKAVAVVNPEPRGGISTTRAKIKLTPDCAAVVEYAHINVPTGEPATTLQSVDAAGVRQATTADGSKFDQAFAALSGAPGGTRLAARPSSPKRLPLAGKPVLRRDFVTLKLPAGTRGLSLHVNGRAVGFNWSLVQDPGLSWDTVPSSGPRYVSLQLPEKTSSALKRGHRYRVTTTTCTVGCITERNTVKVR